MDGRDVLWWQVFPLGFTGAEKERAALPESAEPHRLSMLENWLDHLIELGLNGLALGPIFASATHGYDTLDYLEIDPRLGDLGDFQHLLAACRERGIAVLLDGVFNHVADTHPQFLAAIEKGQGSPESELFRFHWEHVGDDGRPGYDCFEGHSLLASLNHDNPAVVDLVSGVMIHWLDEGITGWRLDAAYAVPASFWREVMTRVRERHPDAYVVGEVIHGDYPALVAESGIDSVTQYELWKSIWSSLNDLNFHELAWNLTRHNEFLDTFTPWTFVGNHDVTRIASRLSDPEAVPFAQVLLFTLGGTPAVYYGDEYGLPGVKEDRAGGDDAVRPAFPEVPLAEELPGGQSWPSHASAQLDLHRELIALRRRHPWLTTARSEIVHLENAVIDYRVTSTGADGVLRVVLNLSDREFVVKSSGTVEAARNVDGQTVRPHGWLVLDESTGSAA